MNEIVFKRFFRKNVTVPTASNFNELTGDQLLYFIRQKQSGIENEEVLKKTTLYLLGDAVKLKKIKQAELIDLSNAHAFLFDECDLRKQLIPQITFDTPFRKNVVLYGPDEALTNCRFLEFLKANTYLLQHFKTKKQEYLDKFIACLYRPAKENYDPESVIADGDRRERFNDVVIEHRAKTTQWIPAHIKEAIDLFFRGCCLFLQEFFYDAFSGSGGKNQYGVHGIIDQLSGEKWRSPEDVENELLYRVLIGICNAEAKRFAMEQNLTKT